MDDITIEQIEKVLRYFELSYSINKSRNVETVQSWNGAPFAVCTGRNPTIIKCNNVEFITTQVKAKFESFRDELIALCEKYKIGISEAPYETDSESNRLLCAVEIDEDFPLGNIRNLVDHTKSVAGAEK